MYEKMFQKKVYGSGQYRTYSRPDKLGPFYTLYINGLV